MAQITVLPHPALCPNGATLEAEAGANLCEALLAHQIDIEHACERSCACTTCHVVIAKGFESLEAASDTEDDLLDRAWGLTPYSRLSCQVAIASAPLTIEIPKYTINHAKER